MLPHETYAKSVVLSCTLIEYLSRSDAIVTPLISVLDTPPIALVSGYFGCGCASGHAPG
jgi:hypothetical protein